MRAPARDKLTDNQERQLVALLLARAVDQLAGVSINGLAEKELFANTLVIGALRDRGLADSRLVYRQRQPRGRWTEYWLTPAGVERARQLQRAPNA